MSLVASASHPTCPEAVPPPARREGTRSRAGRVLLACALASASASARAAGEDGAAGAGSEEAALVEAVSRTPASAIPALVAGDPRFAALDVDARLRVVDAARSPEWRRVLAS